MAGQWTRWRTYSMTAGSTTNSPSWQIENLHSWTHCRQHFRRQTLCYVVRISAKTSLTNNGQHFFTGVFWAFSSRLEKVRECCHWSIIRRSPRGNACLFASPNHAISDKDMAYLQGNSLPMFINTWTKKQLIILYDMLEIVCQCLNARCPPLWANNNIAWRVPMWLWRNGLACRQVRKYTLLAQSLLAKALPSMCLIEFYLFSGDLLTLDTAIKLACDGQLFRIRQIKHAREHTIGDMQLGGPYLYLL